MAVVLPDRDPDYSIIWPDDGVYTTLEMTGGVTLTGTSFEVGTDVRGKYLTRPAASFDAVFLSSAPIEAPTATDVWFRTISEVAGGAFYTQTPTGYVAGLAPDETADWTSIFNYAPVGETFGHPGDYADRRMHVTPETIEWSVEDLVAGTGSGDAGSFEGPGEVLAEAPTLIIVNGYPTSPKLYAFDMWCETGVIYSAASLRQVQLVTAAASGPPLRQVQNAGHSGGPSLRQVHTGI